MPTIILIRPGSTDFDQQGRIQGTLDVPLNGEGDAEVARLVEQLKGREIQTVYFSPCEPAHQTAEQLAEVLDVKSKKLENMHNLDHGLWQGMRIDEVRRKHPKVYRQWQEEPESICPPEGETLDSAKTRVRASLKKVLKRHKQGTIALVAPEPLARVVRGELNHASLGDLWKAGEEHGRWEVIEVDAGAMAAG